MAEARGTRGEEKKGTQTPGERRVEGILVESRRLRGKDNIKRVFKNLNSFCLEHGPVVFSCEYGEEYVVL
jgi:hypothetical protein